MARLPEKLTVWLERFEIAARGASAALSDAQAELSADRPWIARETARRLLLEVPESRQARLIWAEAAEAMGLDDEAVEALEQLAERLPFRADIWLRLAQAQQRRGADPRPALDQALAAGDPVEARDAACLWLADLDLAAADPARAERWLDRVSLGARGAEEVTKRRAETALDLGRAQEAARLAAELGEPEVLDARGWLLRGRLLAAAKDPGAALAFQRALMLEAPRSGRIVSRFVAGCDDAMVLERFRDIVTTSGWAAHPAWRAAFAQAEGRGDEALAALAEALDEQPDPDLVAGQLEFALELRSPKHLRHAADVAEQLGIELPTGVPSLIRAASSDSPESSWAELVSIASPVAEVMGWARELASESIVRWLEEPVAWAPLLDFWSHCARNAGDLSSARQAESIARELERPLRVAVIGEFNAGKSSWVNALLGEAVAPTGILPTTATRHRLVWSPDRHARIERTPGSGPQRVVSHGELRGVLKEIDPATVSEVVIAAPLERLASLEIIDTPGFNAPDQRHTTRAREVFTDIHAAIWLLDASQPLKASEREVLEELAKLGMPVVVLLNKRDRLDANTLATALAHVERGLEEAGIHPEGSVLPCSARLALESPGDPASGWSEVVALLDEALVSRATLLKNRVLRRRAGKNLSLLLARLETARSERQAASEKQAQIVEQLIRAANQIDPESMVDTLEPLLEPAVTKFQIDLRPLEGMGLSEEARRYTGHRARERLPGPLLEALAAELQLEFPQAHARALEGRVAATAGLLGAEVSTPEGLRKWLFSALEELQHLSAERPPRGPQEADPIPYLKILVEQLTQA